MNATLPPTSEATFSNWPPQGISPSVVLRDPQLETIFAELWSASSCANASSSSPLPTSSPFPSVIIPVANNVSGAEGPEGRQMLSTSPARRMNIPPALNMSMPQVKEEQEDIQLSPDSVGCRSRSNSLSGDFVLKELDSDEADDADFMRSHLRRKEYNRIAARRSRQRKREHMQDLERTVELLIEKNLALVKIVDTLRAELMMVKPNAALASYAQPEESQGCLSPTSLAANYAMLGLNGSPQASSPTQRSYESSLLLHFEQPSTAE